MAFCSEKFQYWSCFSPNDFIDAILDHTNPSWSHYCYSNGREKKFLTLVNLKFETGPYNRFDELSPPATQSCITDPSTLPFRIIDRQTDLGGCKKALCAEEVNLRFTPIPNLPVHFNFIFCSLSSSILVPLIFAKDLHQSVNGLLTRQTLNWNMIFCEFGKHLGSQICSSSHRSGFLLHKWFVLEFRCPNLTWP